MISGRREKVVIAKENNFKQAGERFRSFDAARQVSWVPPHRVAPVCFLLQAGLVLGFGCLNLAIC
jgi:hypothetical protein